MTIETPPGRKEQGTAPDAEAPRGESAWEQTRTLALAAVIALAIRAFIFEPFTIPSGSMFPTLLIGDHLFVNKFIYGLKVPFSDLRLPGLREPERGDVVVFDVGRGTRQEIFPLDRCQTACRKEAFIKRVIGLPGDVVSVRAGRVIVNGEPMPGPSTGEFFEDPQGQRLEVFREDLDGRKHLALDDPTRVGKEIYAWRIEDGRYLMMGDNRDNSNDGRFFGTIRPTEMKGPAFMIYWSWDYNGSWFGLLNPVRWWDLLLHKTRWSRAGSGID